MKILDYIIEGGLIFLVIFTPLAFGTVHVWAYTIMELTVLFLITIWFLKMIYQGEIQIPRTPLNISIFLFFLLIFLQLIPLPGGILKTLSPNTLQVYTDTINSIDSTTKNSIMTASLSLYPYATKIELIKVLSYIGVFFLILGNITTRKKTNRLLLTIVITGFLLSIFGLIQHFTWNGKIYWFRELTHGGNPFGPFINKNNFAGYINLIIPTALGILLMKRDKDKKILFGFMAVVMSTALFLSLSRGGIFAFSGAITFMGLLLLFRKYEGSHRKGVLILGGFLVCILFYLFYLGIGPVIERLATLTEEETYLQQQRWMVWSTTSKIIKDYPLTGTGFDTFEAVFPQYQPIEVSNLRYLDAHNDYIQFVSETGVVGSLIALSFFAILFKKILSSLNNSELRTQNYLLIGLLSSAVAFMLSIIFTFNTHIPADALLFAIVLAITAKLSFEKRRERSILNG